MASPNAAEPVPSPARRLDYFLIVTGGELLQGVYPDRHTHFITGVLQPRGGHCVGSLAVDDRPADLIGAFAFAASKAPVIIVTGGLGPTDDDLTRETLSTFTGIALREDAGVVAEMERRYRQPAGQLRANLRRQAQVPVKGRHFENPHGSAVGLVFENEKGTNVVVALPGPPRELQPMVEQELLPYLERHWGLRPAGCSRTLRFVGLGQSAIYQTLHEKIELAPDVVLTSQFEAERVDVTFSLAQDTPEQRARLDRLERQVRELLGANLYASDGASLEDVVARALKSKGAGLLIVDLATGGQLGSSLGASAGGDQVVRGAFVGPDETAMRRLLGAPIAEPGTEVSPEKRLGELAVAAANHTSERPLQVIVVGSPSPSSPGEPRVAIAFGDVDQPLAFETLPGGNGSAAAKLRLTTGILDRLRLRLSAAR